MGQLRKLRRENVVKVLNTLYELGPCSKKKISEQIGLSNPLLTSICNDLRADDIIKEGALLKSKKVGRREVLIDLNFDIKVIVGLRIMSAKTKIIITNLKPQVKFEKTVETLNDDIDGFIKSIIRIVEEYKAENELVDSDFLGIGVGVKGGINLETGLLSNELWDTNVNLKDKFEKLTEIPVFFQNETNNLAMAEYFYSHEKSDFIMVRYDVGVGGAIFKDGKLLLNVENTTGKIGHMIVDPEGEFCPNCKRRGCLESMVSLDRVYSLIAKLMDDGRVKYLSELAEGRIENVTNSMIFEAYRNGSIELSEILRQCAKYFAMAIISSYSMLGIKDYILHGCFFEQPEFFQLVQFYIQELQCCVGAPTLSISGIEATETNLSSAILVLYQTILNAEGGGSIL